MLWMDSTFYWPLMTLVEVKGDIGMASLVPDLDLFQGIFSWFRWPPAPSGGTPYPPILYVLSDVAISFKSHTTLVSPKDPTANVRKAECNKTYIGQTGRQLGERLTEHLNPPHQVANPRMSPSTRRNLTMTSSGSPPEFSIRRIGSTPAWCRRPSKSEENPLN